MADKPADAVARNFAFAVAGLKDSVRFSTSIRQIRDDKRVQANIIRASFIQLVLLASIFVLEFVLAPSLSRKGLELEHSQNVSYYYQLFWLYPLLSLSFFFSSAFSTANLSGRDSSAAIKTGAGSIKSVFTSGSWAVKLFDGITKAAVICQSFVISFILYRIPYIGSSLCFIFMAIINAYYCFEHLWLARGWSLRERARFLESRWPYFLGFGMFSTSISFWHASPILNLAMFSLVYPVSLLQASNARPLPSTGSSNDLLGSAPTASTSSQASTPTPRLPVMWIAVQLNDVLNHPAVKRNILGRSMSGYSNSVKKTSNPTQSYQSPSFSAHPNAPYPSWRPPQNNVYSAQSRSGALPVPTSAQQDQGGQGTNFSVATRPAYLENPAVASTGPQLRTRAAQSS